MPLHAMIRYNVGRSLRCFAVFISSCFQIVVIPAFNPLTPAESEVTWSLHKLMGIYMGDLLLGVIL